MIKNFIKKHKIILLAVIITALATSAVASGYFVIRNEKQNANQKIESLQKSIIDLQAKAEKSVDVIPIEETLDRSAPIIEATIENTPSKIEPPEEKMVSCIAFDGTTLEVSKEECETIKQKNAIVEKTLAKYDDCISDADDDLTSAKEKFQDSLKIGYSKSNLDEYNSSITKYNEVIKVCTENRNDVLEKFTD